MGHGAVAVIADLVLVTAVFLMPAAAGLMFAVKFNIESRAAQCIFALGTPCVTAYVASCFYLVSAPVGRTSEITAFVVVTAAGVAIGVRHSAPSLAALRWWSAPALMTVGASACVLGIGFLHGGTTFPLREAEIRFIHRLANDNVLPLAFAKQALATHRPLPHVLSTTGPWLSSDRPPMETSLYLMVLAVLPKQDPNGLLFETLGTLLQSLWLPALWCLFTVLRLPRRMIAMALAAILLSGFVIFNSFYVWPKLFPAAFLVLLVTLVLTDEWSNARSRITSGIACAVAAGVALLGHEGSALMLIVIVVFTLSARSRWPQVRCAVAGIICLVALMLPWTLYQRYYDPPGTALSKLQLAGTSDFNPHVSLLTTIAHAYRRLGAVHIAQYKWRNLKLVVGYEPAFVRSLWSLAANLFAAGGAAAVRRNTAVEQLRSLSFSFLLPALGFFVLGALAFVALRLRRQSGPDIAVAGRIWMLLAGGVVFWALILFGPRSTITYQGSFAIELLAFAAASICLWRFSHALASTVWVIQAAVGVIVYVIINPRQSYMTPPFGAIQWGEFALGAIGLVAVVVLPLLAPTESGHQPDALENVQTNVSLTTT